jgi:hypothetical protein
MSTSNRQARAARRGFHAKNEKDTHRRPVGIPAIRVFL